MLQNFAKSVIKDFYMESVFDIATAINAHVVDEYNNHLKNRAVARVLANKNGKDGVFWLTNSPNEPISVGARGITGNITALRAQYNTSEQGGVPVYKNTRMGQALIEEIGKGSSYVGPTGKKVSVAVHNRATYNADGRDAIDLQFLLGDDSNARLYSRLSEILKYSREESERLRAEQEAFQKIQEEKERIKLLEEEQRIQEQKRLEQEEKERNEEIARLKEKIKEAEEQRDRLKSFLRTNVSLRSQHILDPYQETAKRSHIYDGIPLVIDGGPGTGKTTTVIQRLKFLLSKESLEEYEAPLTPEQLSRFEDLRQAQNLWLFFSPTDLLLQYLRDNMLAENLIANDNNTRTIEKFRDKVLREYGIVDPSKPNMKKWKGEYSPLIKDPSVVIDFFENYCIDCIKEMMQRALDLRIDSFAWKSHAERLKNVCSRIEISDITTLMKTLDSLRLYWDELVKPIEDELKNTLTEEAASIKLRIQKDNNLNELVIALFTEWEKEKRSQEEDDDSDIADENELEEIDVNDFDNKLYAQIRGILRRLGLKRLDSKTKLNKRQTALYEIIKSTIDDLADIEKIGDLAWFSKHFTVLCRGVESLLIRRIPKMYKDFRRIFKDEESVYHTALLSSIIEKENNKHLHPDEQNFLLGFVNNALRIYSRMSRKNFLDMKSAMADAYRNNVRPIIGIDEATDYTILDFYFMVSFKHYDFSTITLSGDIMQGLNKYGIKKWDELKAIFPDIDVKTLDISYRQTPTLVEMAKSMYKDEYGKEPSYNSNQDKDDNEPLPILFVNDSEEEKAVWLSERIVHVYETYGSLPSVAIFVGEDVNVKRFIDDIEDADILNGIEVVDCTDGKKLEGKDMVRVFRLSEIKGMEFEVAFFYDIDSALQGQYATEMMRKHLYVGISRAATHLAATMTTVDENETVLKYFEADSSKWNW